MRHDGRVIDCLLIELASFSRRSACSFGIYDFGAEDARVGARYFKDLVSTKINEYSHQEKDVLKVRRVCHDGSIISNRRYLDDRLPIKAKKDIKEKY